MFDLPWATHRYLVEPLTRKPHVSRLLVKRYLSFISKIDLPLKTPLQTLMEIAKQDVRSVAGANLRRIMLQSERSSIDDIKNVDIQYHMVPESEAWRVDFVKEIVDMKHGELEVPGMLLTELDYILNYLCTE